MKFTKWVTCDHQIEIHIKPEDINVIFDEPQDGSLKHWLTQLNDVAIFLRGTPTSVIAKLNKAQADTIAEALWEISDRITREHIGQKRR